MSREKNRIRMNDEIKELIEAKGGEMISEYEKASVKIKIKASCGCEVDMLLSNIKKQDEITCREHSRKESPKNLIKRLEGIGIQVFTDPEFIDVGAKDIAIMCSCGHSAMLNYKNLKRRAREGVHLCKECNRFGKGEPKKSKKQDKLDMAKTGFEKTMKDAGAEILTGYKNAKDHISIMCSCGHERCGTANTLKRGVIDGKIRCKSCAGKNSHKKWTEDDWRSKALSCGYKSVEFFDGMTRVEAVGSCDHKIEIQMGGFKKKLQKGVSTCRSCSTKETRDFTEYKMKTLLKNYGGAFFSYNREDRMCDVEYSCGHRGKESLSSLQRKAKENKKIECTECIMSNQEFKPRDSKPESNLKGFISSIINHDVKRNYRVAYPNGKEIDVFIPSLNIGFEMNGMYWHSYIAGKDAQYHIEKTVMFEDMGIKIVHITEYEWNHKREIVQSMIRSRVKASLSNVNARDCIVKNITAKEAKSFLDATHIQGGVGATNDMSYGLFLGGKLLVSVMSFRKTKINNEVELYRFSNLLNFNVRGGFSKILKNFIRNTDFNSIMTYADIRFSGSNPENTVYAQSGFQYQHTTQANYKYFRSGSEMFDRRKFQKHKLKDELDIFDGSKTEWENMKENGYNKIYDCGSLVFRMKL